MAKYSKAAQKRVASAVKRMEKGTLKSGNSGKTVKEKKQAIAIGLSEARKKGAKVPSKKTAPKKAAAKKSAHKKSASKAASKKAVAPKKTATKRVKKTASKKNTTKKSTPKKTADKSSKKVSAAEPAAKKRASRKPTSGKAQQPQDEHNSNTQVNLGAMPDESVTVASGIEADTAPVEEKSPLVVQPEDPLLAQDKKVMAKAAAKSDPRHHFQVSSIKKGAIKPSGKKPLWNR